MPLQTEVSDLNALIAELHRYREEEPELSDYLEACAGEFQHLVGTGWPVDEIVYDANDKPSGIPIELAKVVLALCQFCADHNIDLVDAIQRTRSS